MILINIQTITYLTIKHTIGVGNIIVVLSALLLIISESTCTSIRNFMTDILRADDIPDTEARIIREVIEEEADVLDESLDSHWLQDDVSIDTDFKLDFK